MRRRLHLLWIVTMCAAGTLAAQTVRAQSGSTTAAPSGSANAGAVAAQNRASTASLVAERQRLRAELTRVQGEIDQLKKSDRGLRADYQLRARLADAEAIARRLTEIDERLRVLSPGAAVLPVAPVGDEPVASPTDGPQELDAKADILADQAHRVQAQATALKARIDQVRGRRELRKRAHQLESDPFAPLENSKRRILSSPNGVVPAPGTHTVTTSDSAGGAKGPAAPAGVVTSVPPGGGAGAPSTGLTTSSTQTPSTSQPVPPTESTSASGTGSSVQVHDQLDQGTLAAARRPGSGAAAGNDLDAMERELAALNARAQHLTTQAQALRARARGR